MKEDDRAKVAVAVVCVCSHLLVLLLSSGKISIGIFVNFAQFKGHQLIPGILIEISKLSAQGLSQVLKFDCITSVSAMNLKDSLDASSETHLD